jgi:hypothetical protein
VIAPAAGVTTVDGRVDSGSEILVSMSRAMFRPSGVCMPGTSKKWFQSIHMLAGIGREPRRSWWPSWPKIGTVCPSWISYSARIMLWPNR